MSRTEFVAWDVLRQIIVSGISTLIFWWTGLFDTKTVLILYAVTVGTRLFYVAGWVNGRSRVPFLLGRVVIVILGIAASLVNAFTIKCSP